MQVEALDCNILPVMKGSRSAWAREAAETKLEVYQQQGFFVTRYRYSQFRNHQSPDAIGRAGKRSGEESCRRNIQKAASALNG